MIQRLVVLRRLLVILILRLVVLILRLVVLILRLVVLILRLVILILRRLPELLELELLELLELELLELNLRFKHRMNLQTPPLLPLPLRLPLPELLLRLVPNTVPPSLRSESLLLRLRLEVLSLVLTTIPLVFLRLRSELHPHPL
jgi:hypothetical protein